MLTDAEKGWTLNARDPQAIARLMPFWEWFYDHYFQVKTDGWEHVQKNGAGLFVGSHNGGLAAPDMLMVMVDWFRRFGLDLPAYGLMHSHVWQVYPLLAKLGVQVGAIRAHPKMAIAALQQGAKVLVYPGGAQDAFRPYSQRYQIEFFGRKGFIKLALRESVPIIPVISAGAHETLVVLGNCYQQAKQLNEWGMPWIMGIDPQVFPCYLGLPWGLSFGPLPNFPLPRPIHTRICPPVIFERYGRKAATDREYVENCYQLVYKQMQQALSQLSKEFEALVT